MSTREIYRYELDHRLRSPVTWVCGAFLILISALMFGATYDGPAHANAPAQIAIAQTVAGIFGLLVMAALFGDAAVRDAQSGMDAMLFTSPITKVEYLGGRYLAALTVGAITFLGIPMGAMACTFYMKSIEPTYIGAFHVTPYFTQYLLFGLPNLVLGGAVLFTIGALARHIIPVFIGAIITFIVAIAAMNAFENTQNPILLQLGDPMGLSVLRHVSRYWTESERNIRPIGLQSELLLNRAVWLTVSLFVLSTLIRVFKFAHPGISGSKRERRLQAKQATMGAVHLISDRIAAVEVPRVAGHFGKYSGMRQTLSIARNSLDELIRTKSFAFVLLLCVGLTLLWGWNVGSTAFDTSTWPVTFLITETVLSTRASPLIFPMIVLFAGELVGKDRSSGSAEIVDASPVSESASLAGRFLALSAMIVAFMSAMMIGGLLIQLLQGYYAIDFGLYLRTMFVVNFPMYLVFAAFTMTLHVLVSNKYLGHLVTLLSFIGMMLLSMAGLVRHRLLLYNTDPGWTYSDMNGFGPFMQAVFWFKAYWSAWALMLLVVAALFWARGRETAIRSRFLEARVRLTGPILRSGIIAAALILSLGGFVFYNTNVLSTFASEKERNAANADYEKNYRRYIDTAQPTITRADLRLDLYPDQHTADFRGTFTLVNKTDKPIDSVHVVLADQSLTIKSISFDRASLPALIDDRTQYRIYKLERAIEPADSAKLKFDLHYQASAISNRRSPTDIVDNGSYFNRKLLPFIGYQTLFELAGADTREEFGLPPRAGTPSANDPAARYVSGSVRDAGEVDVHAIIGTARDQTALTPGELRKSWTENGRKYFEYQTHKPTAFGGLVLSARYDVVEDRWRDIPIQIFHHPGHRENLDRTLKSIKASLDYFTEQYGPYPDTQLRIVERPRYGGFGSAHPNIITFAEDYFLSRVNDGEVDQPFYGTAHEIAHTWWNGNIRTAHTRGEDMLSESVANYSAMMLIEKTFGAEEARRIYDFQMLRYLSGRAEQGHEVAALDVDEQPYIAYRKGALALYTLRERIGEAAVNSALRRFQDKYHNAAPPYATSRELYAELRAVTPDSLHGMMSDWFEHVTMWDVATENAFVEKLPSGEYQVTMEIVAKKTRADSAGKEVEIPMDDLIEVGIFPPGVGMPKASALYLREHRITNGKHTIQIVVSEEPSLAGIDPHRKLTDSNREDNVVTVKAKPNERSRN